MSSEENEENKKEQKEQINNNKETKQETEEKEISLNIEDNIENINFEKRKELNSLNTEEQINKKPSCHCSCVLF